MASTPSVSARWHDEGFSLVEVLVAILVLACSAAGVAGLATRATSAVAGARAATSTTALAAQKMEQLRALTWRDDSTRPDGVDADYDTDLSLDPSASSGSGLSSSPANVLDESTAGYVDYLDAFGRWVGNGTSAPTDATFVRRWRIEPRAGQAGRVLVFTVVVAPIAAGGTGGAAGTTRLVSMKTRRSGS